MKFLKILGPGLLYAGAAVGVSHLVQSTRAGAMFGMELIWVIIVTHLLKYPFFECGPRYVAITGNNLLIGYKNLGKLPLYLFLGMTLLTMFIIQAAITVVTAGLAVQLTGIALEPWLWSSIILIICAAILMVDKFSVLDSFVKVIVIALTLTTVIAVIMAFSKLGYQKSDIRESFSWVNKAHLFFVVTLIGWMPAPLDITVWYSLWSVKKNKEENRRASLPQALLDFKVGYWSTMILAVFFVLLGAFCMYPTNKTFSPKAAQFAGQLISLYSNVIGDWSYSLIALAAMTTMFSTALTCLDAFPRVLENIRSLLLNTAESKEKTAPMHGAYRWFLALTVIGTILLLYFFLKDMKALIDLATTIAFVFTPVLAFLNYKVMTRIEATQEGSWSGLEKIFAKFGVLALALFSIFFIYISRGIS